MKRLGHSLAASCCRSRPAPRPSRSRAREAVARALERNPTCCAASPTATRCAAARREARADALPELSVYGSFLRYQDPGFLNSPNIDQFPPELLQAFRPLATNLWDGYATLRQTLWSFSLGKAIRAARLRRAPRRRERALGAPGRGPARDLRLQRATCSRLEQVKVAEKVVKQKEKQLEMARNRRGAGVATELEVLRFEVDLANARTTLLRLRARPTSRAATSTR